MASKFIVLATILAVSNAVPIWYIGNDLIPGVIMRSGRSPSISYGFGSGFSSNIGGISQSTGIGAAFSTGDGAQAYGSGIGASDGGYSRGVGLASTNNAYPVQYHPTYVTVPRTSYGSASAQNFGNYNNAVSSAQTLRGNQYGTAIASTHGNGPARFNSATSLAQNVIGNGAAISSSNSNFGNTFSATRNNAFGSSSLSQAHTGGLGYGSTAVSAAENHGAVQAATAHTLERNLGGIQQSGATSINAPNFQASHSHAINTGFF